MSKSVSFRTILHIPIFKGYREIDMLHPAMDAKVRPYLWIMGVDTRLPITVVVANHRDLLNKTGVGYLYHGEMRRDREYAISPWCSIIERITIAMCKDVSLGVEMCNLMNKTVDFEKAAEMGVSSEEISWSKDREANEDIDCDYIKNSQIIKTLEEVRDSVRGNNNNNVKEVN